jgi:aminopeptidase N
VKKRFQSLPFECDLQRYTTDDFFAAMTDANGGNDISRLKNWYSQAGTPTLKCTRAYDAAAKTFSLTLEQVLPKTPDDASDEAKQAQLIPVAVGLIGPDGKDLAINVAGVAVSGEEGGAGSAATGTAEGGLVLRLNAMKATFTFKDVAAEPVPSVLRGFSAPVKLEMSPALSTDDLLFTLANDVDAFNRWEASQILSRGIMTRTIAKLGAAAAAPGADVGSAVKSDEAWDRFAAACKGIVADATAKNVDRAWVEEALSFPGVSSLVQELAPIDPLAVFAVVKGFGGALQVESS